MGRSKCAQKTSWSCHGWLNTASPSSTTQRDSEKNKRRGRQTGMTDRLTEQSFSPSPGLCSFFFILSPLWKMINMLRSISAMLTAGVSLNGFMSTAQGTKANPGKAGFYIVRARVINTHIADHLLSISVFESRQLGWAGERWHLLQI